MVMVKKNNKFCHIFTNIANIGSSGNCFTLLPKNLSADTGYPIGSNCVCECVTNTFKPQMTDGNCLFSMELIKFTRAYKYPGGKAYKTLVNIIYSDRKLDYKFSQPTHDK